MQAEFGIGETIAALMAPVLAIANSIEMRCVGTTALVVHHELISLVSQQTDPILVMLGAIAIAASKVAADILQDMSLRTSKQSIAFCMEWKREFLVKTVLNVQAAWGITLVSGASEIHALAYLGLAFVAALQTAQKVTAANALHNATWIIQ